jgi:riboflavin biosynthesis protein RibD
MQLALSLGRRGLGRTWPNPAVGAVVVKDGVIVGRGWTQAGGRPHAEPEALRRAGEAARGATLYVTLEPCSHFGKSPPCVDAVIASGIARVVSAIEDPNPEVAGQGHAKLRAAGITVDVGLGAAEAAHDHAGHFRRIRDKRPHVILKLAVSADDKIGAAGHKPVAITGEAAKTRVHLLRAQCDAILVGIGTVLADDPLLTCRLPGMEARRRCGWCWIAPCASRHQQTGPFRAPDAAVGHDVGLRRSARGHEARRGRRAGDARARPRSRRGSICRPCCSAVRQGHYAADGGGRRAGRRRPSSRRPGR